VDPLLQGCKVKPALVLARALRRARRQRPARRLPMRSPGSSGWGPAAGVTGAAPARQRQRQHPWTRSNLGSSLHYPRLPTGSGADVAGFTGCIGHASELRRQHRRTASRARSVEAGARAV